MSRERAIDAAFELTAGEGEGRFELAAELSLDEGVLVLFGPSGAGKSLTLQALGGLVRPARGHVRVRGRTLFDAHTWVPAHLRQVAYVPQHHSLFPFCSVMDNVLFGLPRAQRASPPARVRELVAELGIERIEDARPASLSGGERQRVALARALAVEPTLLLLDEPFAAIDVKGRAELRHILRRTLERRGTPAVFVTHDPLEATVLGDRVVCFERGRTTASGAPRELLAAERAALREGLD